MLAINILGQTFGRWTVIGRAENAANCQARWRVRCECGTEGIRESIVLRDGRSQSCGCIKREQTAAMSIKHGHSFSGKITPTYRSWCGMIARCCNPRHRSYDRYGGRGIAVCERWLTFIHFLEDMGEKPAGQSVHRVDNDGPYEPGNCRWASGREQARHKTNNHLVTFQGETLTIAEWSERTGIKASVISERLIESWSAADALTKPGVGHVHLVTLDGETRPIGEWIRMRRLRPATVYARIRNGCSVAEALEPRK